MAWLLDLYGFNVSLLSGGYKAYRHWVLQQFDKNYSLRVVGGCTGGNKTGMIHELEKCGEAVIDLEGIAVHKGSAFGNLDRFEQPSQEHFENLLAEELHQKSQGGRTIWLEGESQRLGLINIPLAFHMNMRREPLFFMDIPFPLRLEHILTGYGRYNKEYLISAILRIKKKLGGLETKNAINALLEDDVPGCFAILLKYYDKLYTRAIQTKEEGGRETITIVSDSTNPILNTEKLIQHVRNRN